MNEVGSVADTFADHMYGRDMDMDIYMDIWKRSERRKSCISAGGELVYLGISVWLCHFP